MSRTVSLYHASFPEAEWRVLTRTRHSAEEGIGDQNPEALGLGKTVWQNWLARVIPSQHRQAHFICQVPQR